MSLVAADFDRSRDSVRRVVAVLSRLGPAVGLSADFCGPGNAFRLLLKGSTKRAGDPSPAGIVSAFWRESTLSRSDWSSSLRWDEMRPLAACTIFASSLAGLAAVAPAEADGHGSGGSRETGVAQDSHCWRRANRSLHRAEHCATIPLQRAHRSAASSMTTCLFLQRVGPNRRPGLARSRRVH